MTKEEIRKELRLRKIKSINHFCIKETEQNELLSNKNKKFCTTLNCIEHFLQ